MDFPVLTGASYVLAQTPDFIPFGSNQVAARTAGDQEFLDNLEKAVRPFDISAAYPANQCYIGNITPEQLAEIPQPWYNNQDATVSRFGKFGEIMPEIEFYALLKYNDAFDLVTLTADFIERANVEVANHPVLKDLFTLDAAKAEDQASMQALVDTHKAEPLMFEGQLVGVVKQAHDQDENLSAHIILENLAVKASGVLAALHLKQQGLDLSDVDYIIECSEEACGDINQRGGGNFAKAIGELVGCDAATGCDIRGFCAAPAHTIIHAAALVKAGVFNKVMVVAGGAVGKLALNGRDHVKKDVPVLEDMLAGFACIIGQNDGVSPIVNTDIVGRHTIGTGSAPQAVMNALISAPLAKHGRPITSVDRFSAELQNAEITKPAGAGDVPEANYKMIAALAVKQGQLERKELMNFVEEHGIVGFAPTQGHIPSGAPYLGHGRDAIMGEKINNFMVVGKGSLFLGRMTNLFDGISVLIEKNSGESASAGFDQDEARQLVAEAMKDVAERLLEK